MARIRQHGFSEREVKIAAAKLMADIESAYLERDQVYSTDVREEYVRNFLHGAPAAAPAQPIPCTLCGAWWSRPRPGGPGRFALV